MGKESISEAIPAILPPSYQRNRCDGLKSSFFFPQRKRDHYFFSKPFVGVRLFSLFSPAFLLSVYVFANSIFPVYPSMLYHVSVIMCVFSRFFGFLFVPCLFVCVQNAGGKNGQRKQPPHVPEVCREQGSLAVAIPAFFVFAHALLCRKTTAAACGNRKTAT